MLDTQKHCLETAVRGRRSGRRHTYAVKRSVGTVVGVDKYLHFLEICRKCSGRRQISSLLRDLSELQWASTDILIVERSVGTVVGVDRCLHC